MTTADEPAHRRDERHGTSQDRSGDLVVRLYESLGTRTNATVTWDVKTEAASVVDLLERPLAELATDVRTERRAELEFRPFQIVTLRIRRSAGLEEEIG